MLSAQQHLFTCGNDVCYLISFSARPCRIIDEEIDLSISPTRDNENRVSEFNRNNVDSKSKILEAGMTIIKKHNNKRAIGQRIGEAIHYQNAQITAEHNI